MDSPILVTGFGPFPGVADNPTAVLAQRLNGSTVAGVQIVAHVLDVAYVRAAQQALAWVAHYRPRAVIHFGVAMGSQAIRIEVCAVNQKTAAVLDVDGERGDATALRHDRPVAESLWTQLQPGPVLAQLAAAGLPAVESDDAGRYVCNALYYQVLLALDGQPPSLFVHVPQPDADVDCDGVPWTHDRIAEAAQTILATVLQDPMINQESPTNAGQIR